MTASSGSIEAGEGGAASRRPMASLLSAPHLVMIVAGALAFLLVLVVLRDRTATLQVAVAGRDLTAGEQAEPSMFRLVEVPAGVASLGGLLGPDDTGPAAAAGRVITADVAAGTPMRSGDIAMPRPGGPRRVMSIGVDASRAVDGALDRGDVIDIIRVAAGAAEYAATGVEIAAVGTGGGPGRDAVTLSLVVDTGEALEIAAALTAGELYLVRATGADPIERIEGNGE